MNILPDFQKAVSRAIVIGGVLAAGPLAAKPEKTSARPDSFTLTVKGFFDQKTVDALSVKLQELRAKDPQRKIRLEFFDTAGGEVEQGFRLADALYKTGNVDLVCRGNLQSMGATVFVSYQGGERIAANDCKNFMMHDLITTLWSPMGGGMKLVRTYIDKIAENLNQAVQIMTRATAEASRLSPKAAEALFGEDCNLNPQNAYRMGLIDRFEAEQAVLPARMENVTAQDVYKICGTSSLAEAVPPMPDWNKMNFGLRQKLTSAP